ncbi:hypothetical protein J3E64_002894 [Sphingobium sp. OAS761]|nr:hypothetical protein [Sphingobium sp. OAS761]
MSRDPDKPDFGFLWFSLLLTVIGLAVVVVYGG